jgi:hypothetical protein
MRRFRACNDFTNSDCIESPNQAACRACRGAGEMKGVTVKAHLGFELGAVWSRANLIRCRMLPPRAGARAR